MLHFYPITGRRQLTNDSSIRGSLLNASKPLLPSVKTWQKHKSFHRL